MIDGASKFLKVVITREERNQKRLQQAKSERKETIRMEEMSVSI